MHIPGVTGVFVSRQRCGCRCLHGGDCEKDDAAEALLAGQSDDDDPPPSSKLTWHAFINMHPSPVVQCCTPPTRAVSRNPSSTEPAAPSNIAGTWGKGGSASYATLVLTRGGRACRGNRRWPTLGALHLMTSAALLQIDGWLHDGRIGDGGGDGDGEVEGHGTGYVGGGDGDDICGEGGDGEVEGRGTGNVGGGDGDDIGGDDGATASVFLAGKKL